MILAIDNLISLVLLIEGFFSFSFLFLSNSTHSFCKLMNVLTILLWPALMSGTRTFDYGQQKKK